MKKDTIAKCRSLINSFMEGWKSKMIMMDDWRKKHNNTRIFTTKRINYRLLKLKRSPRSSFLNTLVRSIVHADKERMFNSVRHASKHAFCLKMALRFWFFKSITRLSQKMQLLSNRPIVKLKIGPSVTENSIHPSQVETLVKDVKHAVPTL